MTYQPGIPTGLVDLNVDYQNLQTNFTVLDTTFGVDHVPFSNTTPQTGYHEDIHFNPFSTTTTNPPNNYVAQTAGTSTQYPDATTVPPNQAVPTVVAGIGQLWSAEVNDGINTDTGLFWLSGNGLKTALTRNFQPSATLLAGSTFLAGGIMLQWGFATVTPNSNSNIVFARAFPNALLNFQTTVISIAAPAAGSVVTIFPRTAPALASTSQMLVANTQAVNVSFYWLAIGY